MRKRLFKIHLLLSFVNPYIAFPKKTRYDCTSLAIEIHSLRLIEQTRFARPNLHAATPSRPLAFFAQFLTEDRRCTKLEHEDTAITPKRAHTSHPVVPSNKQHCTKGGDTDEADHSFLLPRVNLVSIYSRRLRV